MTLGRILQVTGGAMFGSGAVGLGVSNLFDPSSSGNDSLAGAAILADGCKAISTCLMVVGGTLVLGPSVGPKICRVARQIINTKK